MEGKYYRVYRPYNKKVDNIESYYYLYSILYSTSREESIRYFQIIQEDLKKIFEYVEPSKDNENVYSFQIYKLLLLICTEVENQLKAIMINNGYKMNNFMNMKNDYYKLNEVLRLNEYKVNLIWNNSLRIFQPFGHWSSSEYKPLEWYQAYNKSKHNRQEDFKEANLKNLLNACAGLYIILYSQYYQFANVVSITNSQMLIDDSDCLVIPNMANLMCVIQEPKWRDEEKYSIGSERLKKYFEEQ